MSCRPGDYPSTYAATFGRIPLQKRLVHSSARKLRWRCPISSLDTLVLDGRYYSVSGQMYRIPIGASIYRRLRVVG